MKRVLHWHVHVAFKQLERCYMFLDASTHLYKRVCPSVGRSVGLFFISEFHCTSINASPSLMGTIKTVHLHTQPPSLASPSLPPLTPLPSICYLDASLFLLELVCLFYAILVYFCFRCCEGFLASTSR